MLGSAAGQPLGRIPPTIRAMTATHRPSAPSPRRRRLALLVAATAALLLLAACGGSSDGTSAEDAAVSTGGSAPAASTPVETGPRELTDAFGPVEVEGQPANVIADSVSTMAHLAALGLTPVGAALPEGISPEYIGGDLSSVQNLVADDGWTLNVERTLAMQPDLVVAVGADYNAENCTRYKAALTTFCFKPDDGSEAGIKTAFREIAAAVGREEQAETAITAYDERKDALKARIAAAGLAGKKAGIVRFDSGGFIGVRVDGAQTLLEELGFVTPEWPPVGESGYVELSLETLDELNAAEILFVTLDDDVDPDKVAAFSSPLWKRLKPVTDDKLHVVSAWNGSDLPQLDRILDEVEQTVVAPAETAS